METDNKTAMQLLFEEFKSLSKASKDSGDIQTSNLIDFLCERELIAIEKEKQQIIDAVNEHDKKCINICNNMVKKIIPKIDSLFEHNGEEGSKYYKEKYEK